MLCASLMTYSYWLDVQCCHALIDNIKSFGKEILLACFSSSIGEPNITKCRASSPPIMENVTSPAEIAMFTIKNIYIIHIWDIYLCAGVYFVYDKLNKMLFLLNLKLQVSVSRSFISVYFLKMLFYLNQYFEL